MRSHFESEHIPECCCKASHICASLPANGAILVSVLQDMAVLVHDQGLQIDDIDANVSTYELRTEQAGQEIVKADTYQRAARNRKCILLTIVIIVVVVLVLVIAQ